MRYLHTMIRVADLEKSLRFYTEGLGFRIVKRNDYSDGRFTLAFLQAEGDQGTGPMIELTYNWGVDHYQRGDAYGHTAFLVSSIESVRGKLKSAGYDLSWGPGTTPDGRRKMAFVDDPDGYEIELLEGVPV